MEQRDLFGKPGSACIFCRIRDREAHGWVVHEDDDFLAFLDHRPLLEGHTLLVTREHHETLLDVPPDRVGAMFQLTQQIARAVESGLEAQGSFVAVNTRISQTVPHVHVHVVPRWRRDGLFGRRLIWFRRKYASRERAASVQKAIIRALANPG